MPRNDFVPVRPHFVRDELLDPRHDFVPPPLGGTRSTERGRGAVTRATSSFDEELDAQAIRLADATVARSRERWLRELEDVIRKIAPELAAELDELQEPE
jgi:hypothetical protein